MKKQIPKFDQKAWVEKQAKSAENYSKNGGYPPIWYNPTFIGSAGPDKYLFSKPSRADAAKRMSDYLDMINRVSNGNNIFEPNDSPPAGITSGIALDYLSRGNSDAYDQFLFGGDSEDTMELPKGYFDQTGFDWASTGASNPAKTNCDLGIHEYVNVGFHHDILVCKHCDKAKE